MSVFGLTKLLTGTSIPLSGSRTVHKTFNLIKNHTECHTEVHKGGIYLKFFGLEFGSNPASATISNDVNKPFTSFFFLCHGHIFSEIPQRIPQQQKQLTVNNGENTARNGNTLPAVTRHTLVRFRHEPLSCTNLYIFIQISYLTFRLYYVKIVVSKQIDRK